MLGHRRECCLLRRAKYVQEIYWLSGQVSTCSPLLSGSWGWIFFRKLEIGQNIWTFLLLKCTHVASGNCMNLVSDSKRHDSSTLFENSYWVVAVIPNIEN